MQMIKVTEQELEIIELIRNIKRAYPNGYDQLRDYLEYLIDSETIP